MMVMGDSIDPSTDGEYLFAALIVVIGVTMNATIFASIASYASQISADTALHKNKMNSIQRSIKMLKLPMHLATRIQQYYEYCWTRHRDFSAQHVRPADRRSIRPTGSPSGPTVHLTATSGFTFGSF